MALILFEQGKRIGEISDWSITPSVPVYKEVLGKRVLIPASLDTCSFITPKPVHRKSQLTILEDQKVEIVLQVKSVRGMTVTATILERNKL